MRWDEVLGTSTGKTGGEGGKVGEGVRLGISDGGGGGGEKTTYWRSKRVSRACDVRGY